MPNVDVHLQALDWAILFLYAVGVLGAGWFYSRRNKTVDDYLVGGRNMKPWAVGFSFFVAVFSTLTYLARPGEMIRFGPLTLAGMTAVPLIYWIVGWFIIPVFMRLRVTSGNELLERRLGLAVRQTGVSF
jgi:SSS family solute:Na+ symporter